MKDPAWHGAALLCRDCDVFVGYSAFGVVRMPDQLPTWLFTHCWLCSRDYEAEIEREIERQNA